MATVANGICTPPHGIVMRLSKLMNDWRVAVQLSALVPIKKNLLMADHVDIRVGVKSDLPRVLELVRELAAFEKAPHEVTNTLAMMEEDGFGPDAVYGFFVAETKGEIVGLSLYYWRYSTWKGKRLYLEDIIVTERVRGKGIGKKLFDRTMQHTLDEGCTGMMWQVLDWNEPAIKFYQKYGSRLDGEWINCHLESDQIRQHFSPDKK